MLPCYNIERFVGDCIDSINAQGLKEEEYEIICVNDCSPDHTRDVVIEYQKKHKNIILIDHEKNKRVGAARNTGFYAAKGKYVWFIDPDDTITLDAMKELLPILDKDELDFVQFGHDWMTEDKKPIDNPPFDLNCKFDTEVISGIDFIHTYQQHGLVYADMHSGPFARIYRRSYLVENKIIFPEVTYYEDQYQALHGLIAAKRMRNVNKCYYNYRVIETSYSHAPMSIAKRAGQVNMCVGMVRLMRAYNVNEKDVQYVWKRYAEDLRYFNTHFVLFMPNEERKEFLNLIVEDLPLLHELMPKSSWVMAEFPKAYIMLANIFSAPLQRIKELTKKGR